MSILSHGGVILKERFPNFTLRIQRELLDKLGYVAEYEGRTKNKEIMQLIKKHISVFEDAHGEIKIK